MFVERQRLCIAAFQLCEVITLLLVWMIAETETHVPGRKCSAYKLYVLFTTRSFTVPSLCNPGPFLRYKMSSVFWL